MRPISWNVVLASALLLPGAAVGQAENAAAVPRMPWGAADLQGIWLYQTSTPLERDAAFADKATSAASWDGPSPSSHHHGTNACKSSRPPVTSPCHDEFGESRLVPVTFREPLPATIRQWAGISRGRWEGDTLVIETTHFNGQRGRWWRACRWRAARASATTPGSPRDG